MNVLVTCAGRRGYLIRSFREALGERGAVFAADATPEAPALQAANGSFVVPRVDDPRYVDRLLEICRDRSIDLLIPLNDLELPLIAGSRDRFTAVGTVPVISSPEVVRICFDKWATVAFLRAHAIPAPPTFLTLQGALHALLEGRIAFPLVVKPRWGSASIGVDQVADRDELMWSYALQRKRFAEAPASIDPDAEDAGLTVLIQEWLDGQEHGIDVINDLAGRHVTTFARRKLLMRAGETDRAMTVEHLALERLGATIGRALGHVGVLDCDVFVDGDRCTVLELNPRFGGGYPFEEAAGANIPAALLAWASGREPDRSWLQPAPNIIASKSDGLVVILPDAWPEPTGEPAWSTRGC
jgi:carbamoyl-phosphate synthase large subunit